jgi:hypothetical protein
MEMTLRAKNNLGTPDQRQVEPAQSNECSNPFQTRELYCWKTNPVVVTYSLLDNWRLMGLRLRTLTAVRNVCPFTKHKNTQYYT